jgi:hypothetical protein
VISSAWHAAHPLHDGRLSQGIAAAVRALVSQSVTDTIFLFATERERCCNPAMTTRNGGVRWRWLVLFAMATALFPSRAAFPTELSPDTSREIESVFRSAMEAWAAEAHWRLWEMGTLTTRAALPQSEFTDRLRRGNATPANHGDLEAVVVSESGGIALLRARLILQQVRGSKSQIAERVFERPFILRHEDGGWRVNLWDFVGMASAFPPDYLPTRPIPPPHTKRR